MFELTNITKEFLHRKIFDNFKLTFEAGKVYAIIGQSGSGKTTLLNMIAKLESYEGSILYEGKELSKIKTKVAFNLTKRQIICFAAALAMGLPLFFLLKDSAGTSMAAFAMIVVMLPCFLLAMYEKHGQPLEVVIKNVIQTKFIRPKERPYQTENFYAVIEKQRKLEKEVSAIVNGRTKNHDPRGKKSREV